MSRTIRRTKTNKQYSRFEKDYTHHHLEEWGDMVQTGWRNDYRAFPFVPKPEPEYTRAKWRFHSDCGLNIFRFEKCFNRPWRMSSLRLQSKYELIKWLKDPDYEIQISRIKLVWDYC